MKKPGSKFIWEGHSVNELVCGKAKTPPIYSYTGGGSKFSSGERKLLDFVTVSATSWIPVLTMYLFFIISSVIPEKLPFNFATVFWSIIVLSFKFFLTAVSLSTLLL